MRAFSIAPFGHGEEMWVVRREELREYLCCAQDNKTKIEAHWRMQA